MIRVVETQTLALIRPDIFCLGQTPPLAQAIAAEVMKRTNSTDMLRKADGRIRRVSSSLFQIYCFSFNVIIKLTGC